MSGTAATAADVELLIFRVGRETYGADASQVVRIDRPGQAAFSLGELGALEKGGRALVFKTAAGEGQLRVDEVHGVHPVPVDCLRRIPPAAAPSPCAIGIWLDGERPVLLIDLWETPTLQGRQ